MLIKSFSNEVRVSQDLFYVTHPLKRVPPLASVPRPPPNDDEYIAQLEDENDALRSRLAEYERRYGPL